MKRILAMILAMMLLAVSAAYADSAVDVIMNTGTTQAFTDEASGATTRDAFETKTSIIE